MTPLWLVPRYLRMRLAVLRLHDLIADSPFAAACGVRS